MKLSSYIYWLFGMFLCSTSLFSQKTWTLEECIQYANEHNLVIQQAQQSSRINEIHLEQSKAMRLPSLNANVRAGRNWGRSFNSINLELVDEGIITASVGANLNLTLFNGLSINNSIKQNRLLNEAGQLNVLAAKENYNLLIAQSYLQILQLKEQISNTKNQIASSNEQLENARMKFKKGLIAEYNVLQLESRLRQEEWNIEQLNGQLRIAKVNLMHWMDLEAKLLPSLNFTASLNSNYSSASNLVDFTTTTQETTIGYLESNPNETVMAQEVISVPVISDYSFWTQLNDNLNPYVGVALSVPVFSNKRNSSQVQIAKVNSEITRLQENDTKNQLRKDIEQAYANLENAISRYEVSEKQLELSERLFKNAKYSHESGLISTTEFTIEKNDFLNAENSMVIAKYEYLFSRMILNFYNGKPIKL